MTPPSVAAACVARLADTKANFVTRSPWRKKPPPCAGSPPPLQAASLRASVAAFPPAPPCARPVPRPSRPPSGSPLRHPSLLGCLGSLANPPVLGGSPVREVHEFAATSS